MENTFQKQARELKEVRFESFKQGALKERDKILELIEVEINTLNNITTINGRKPKCCQAQLMVLKQEINKLAITKE